MTAPGTETIHASCVLLRERGVLIRGPSGSGKSTLARRLVEAVSAAGAFAAHVADDRVVLAGAGPRLVARPVPAIAGRLEIRGLGLVRVPHESASVLDLVLDLADEPPARLPEPAALAALLLGRELPRAAARLPDALEVSLWRLRGLDDTGVTEP